MKKSELVQYVADKTDLPKATTEKALDGLFHFLEEQLAAGEEIPVGNLGKFVVDLRPERKGRNPATGAEIIVPPTRVVRFKAGKALKDALNP